MELCSQESCREGKGVPCKLCGPSSASASRPKRALGQMAAPLSLCVAMDEVGGLSRSGGGAPILPDISVEGLFRNRGLMGQHQLVPWGPLASGALWVSGLFPELPKPWDRPGLSCSACQSSFLSCLKNPLVNRLGGPKDYTFTPHPRPLAHKSMMLSLDRPPGPLRHSTSGSTSH